MTLNTDDNITDPDAFYAELLDAHEGLTDDESAAFNARLILLLANHIGDRAVLRAGIRAAAKPGQDMMQTPQATAQPEDQTDRAGQAPIRKGAER